MLAAVWLDVVFIPLLLLGVETIDTPAGGGYGRCGVCWLFCPTWTTPCS